MAKEEYSFEDFLANVNPVYHEFVTGLNAHISGKGCGTKLEMAKSGFVLSYLVGKKKKTMLNFVFRKDGLVIRIYADNLSSYAGLLDGLPQEMKETMAKAPLCKRLHDPTACSSRCPMGYTYTLEGNEYKKCRYSAVMFAVKQEYIPAIEEIVKKELEARLSA